MVLHVGNCVFRRLEKNSLFYEPSISRPRNFYVKILSWILRLIREYIWYLVKTWPWTVDMS